MDPEESNMTTPRATSRSLVVYSRHGRGLHTAERKAIRAVALAKQHANSQLDSPKPVTPERKSNLILSTSGSNTFPLCLRP
jgi:hypothetical protein